MPPQTRSNTRKPMTKAKRSSDITTVDLDPPEPLADLPKSKRTRKLKAKGIDFF